MEIKQLWDFVRKWIWLAVLCAALAGSTAYLVSSSTTPVYRTTTTLLITPGTPQAAESYSTLMASERLAQTYAQLLESDAVMERTTQRLGSTLDFQISAMPIPDTQLLSVEVTGTDPDRITEAANTLAEIFIEWQTEVQRSRYIGTKASLHAEMQLVQADIEETEAAIQALYNESSNPDANELRHLQDQLNQYRNNHSSLLRSYSTIELAEVSSGDTITIVSRARQPQVPIHPKPLRNSALAAIAGAMVALMVALLVEYLDDTVKTPDDLQAMDLNVLAAVQRVSLNGKAPGQQLFAISQRKSLTSEAYRTLRTNLQFSSLDRPIRTLVVGSAVAAEGKTTTAANLAVVISQTGKPVILIDGDLRRPTVHKIFDLSNRKGLTTALVADPAELDDHLLATPVDNLRVLTAGPIPPNPQELLGSQRMEELLLQLQEKANIVIIDTPPLLAVSDASILAARADGAVLVVHTAKTRRAAIRQAAANLDKVGGHLMGIVLNMVHTRKDGGYYYYSYYYDDDEREPGDAQGLSGWLRRLGRRLGAGKGQAA